MRACIRPSAQTDVLVLLTHNYHIHHKTKEKKLRSIQRSRRDGVHFLTLTLWGYIAHANEPYSAGR